MNRRLRSPLAAAALALSLLAPTFAALAQVSPPVPALPDQERRTAYNITGSTCVCAVNFAIYGDSTDVDAWIQVWVNGTRRLSTDPSFGWSLSSSTGALGSIARPITNAILTFKGPQTGVIQIVGARRPRRVSQFGENQSVAARDLNQAFTDTIAMLRESWDKTSDIYGRGLFSQPGNAMGPLPLPTACVNGFLGFGANGLTPTCAQFPASGQSTPQYQIFPAPGAVTTLTLTNTPLPGDGLLVVVNFDGVTQARTTWSINVTTGVITFGTPIPANVQIVEVDWFAPAAVIFVNNTPTSSVVPFANIAALRSNTAALSNAYVSGYATASDGGEGALDYVSTDTTTADNNCTIFVDAVGHRWYRTAANGSVNVKWCGAKGDGATNDVVAINRAVDLVCNGHATIANPTPFVGTWVWFPAGNYVVDGGINVDNFSGGYLSGGCNISGAGNNATVLLTKTGFTNNMLEILGTSDVVIKDLFVRASAGTSVVNNIAIAASNLNPCNVIRLDNVGADAFTNVNSLVAIQNCSEGLIVNSTFSVYAPGTSTHNLVSITSTNPYGWDGSYATISPASPAQSGGWNFVQTQLHDITHGSGSSTVIPFTIQGGNSSINWFGGIIAGSTIGSTGGMVTLMAGSGTVTGLSFNGVNFYADNGTQADYIIFPNVPVTGLSLRNCSILDNLGVLAAVTGSTYKSLDFSSNVFSGPAISILIGNSGTVISSHIDAAGQNINLGAGGSITHSVMLNPGAITAGTNTSNGSF